MLKIENLTKRFGQVKAVDRLSFAARPGRVTGFLGPNGAGKTTTLRAALGLVAPTSGSATFDGRRYAQIRRPGREIGAALEASSYHPGRTGLAHLEVLAAQVGVPRARCQEVLGFVGLGPDGRRRVGQYSLGMRARLQLAATLLGDPATLLLDEPNNGLDPEGIAWMRSLLRRLAAEGRTVLISSHVLSEVQLTVDDVVIVARGRLVHASPLEELRALARPVTLVRAAQPERFARLAAERGWQGAPEAGGVVVQGPTAEQIGDAAAGAGLALHQLATRAGGLEATFLALTGQAGGGL
ncbi:MAG: ATP-binding cassette domain-containing protein [Bifidobacteriaceae bacterium]|jgi:ABC-2 type transport system ATP-binding protein|nr:ATP-binding cassette domain-containing protein [Bifidobacteriaceae bacterium]